MNNRLIEIYPVSDNYFKLIIDWFTSSDYVTRNSGDKTRYKYFNIKLGLFNKGIIIQIKIGKLPYINYEQYTEYRKARLVKEKNK